ncbi:MAG: CsgG/HfaB family protein [Thermodesulfobacteriota bacterium]|nr:CsgG/HfaB family protein [Thermodesulfobacteriota bacterium]
MEGRWFCRLGEKRGRFLKCMAAALVIWLMPLIAQADFEKIRIAVLDFQLQGQGFETEDMGAIVAEWFITALVKAGRFDIVERTMLQKIINEKLKRRGQRRGQKKGSSLTLTLL